MTQRKELNLRGTGVALVTPFVDDNGAVDFNAYQALLNHVISNKVNYLAVFGTTGEPVTLSDAEKKDVLDCAYDTVAGRCPIIVGCGGYNTKKVIDKLQSGDYDKADAILSVSPYYNKPSQEGIFQHYKVISENSPVPVVAYNVPGRTGSNVEAKTSIRISHELPNVIALKEASPSVEQFTYIKRGMKEDFQLISGDDSIIIPHMSLGGVGAISVTANVLPAEYSEMVRLANAGKFDEALKIHLKLIEFTDSLFEEGSPSGVKAALSMLGIVKNHVRMPLTTVSKEQYARIEKLLAEIKS